MNILYTGKLSIVVMLFAAGTAFAQKSAKPAQPPTPSPVVADAGPALVWKKQIVRVVDMSEKSDVSSQRISDVSSENTLIEMFVNLIRNGKVVAYVNSDHNFTTRLTIAELNKMLAGKKDTVLTTDAKGKTISKVISHDLNLNTIHKFRVLEEWSSYPSTGKTEIQTIGIAPLRDVMNDDGTSQGMQAMFWLRFVDISAILVRYQQYHPNNTLAGHIWDDFFKSDLLTK